MAETKTAALRPYYSVETTRRRDPMCDGTGLNQSRSFWRPDFCVRAAAADEALRRVFVNAPLMMSVPVAVYSLLITTFIHQSQLSQHAGNPEVHFIPVLSFSPPPTVILLRKGN